LCELAAVEDDKPSLSIPDLDSLCLAMSAEQCPESPLPGVRLTPSESRMPSMALSPGGTFKFSVPREFRRTLDDSEDFEENKPTILRLLDEA